jgi:hypothetical protein
MGLNPLLSLVEHVRWHSPHESANDAAHMVVRRSSVNGCGGRFFGLKRLGVQALRQAEALQVMAQCRE